MDLDSRQVLSGPAGEVDARRSAVQQSERECGLLATLAGRPNRDFARGELRGLVFEDAESEVVIDTYVHYLRRKLGRAVVRTVRGRGYQLGHL